MNIDERIGALAMNLELATRDIQDLTAHMTRLATAMTELARVVKDHEQRLNDIEGE